MPLALTGLHVAGLKEAIHDVVQAPPRDTEGLGDVWLVPAIPDVQPDRAPAQVSRVGRGHSFALFSSFHPFLPQPRLTPIDPPDRCWHKVC